MAVAIKRIGGASNAETTAESRRLEERNEQLRAEKERLMYDVQRRGNPLNGDDARSAIRRGLQARPRAAQPILPPCR